MIFHISIRYRPYFLYIAGTCGTGNPYYLLCGTCRSRYAYDSQNTNEISECTTDNNDQRRSSCHKLLTYAKLLQLAPDLLGKGNQNTSGKWVLIIIVELYGSLTGWHRGVASGENMTLFLQISSSWTSHFHTAVLHGQHHVCLHVLFCLLIVVDGVESLLSDDQPSLQSISPEQVLSSLGLSERQPIPNVITFPEADPLGSHVCCSNTGK